MRSRALPGLLAASALIGVVVALVVEASILIPWGISVVAALVVGALVTWRVPDNRIGWLIMTFAWTTSVALALQAYGFAAVDPETQGWFHMGGSALSTFGVMALPAALLRFPDGALPSRRWASVEWLIVVGAPLGALAALLNGGWGGDFEQAQGAPPFREATGPLGDTLSAVFFPLLSISLLMASVSLVVRYRASLGEERLKLKWLAFSGGFVIASLVVLLVTGSWNLAVTDAWEAMLLALAFASVPAAIGVAVLRYRLYDIDVVISRTLIYGSLAVLIAGLYVGIVVGLGSVLGLHGDGDGPNALLGVAALVVIPIAFQPARRRLERWANRVVYGRKSTPYEVLSTFSQNVATVDPDVLIQMARSLAEGTSAEAAGIWTVGEGGPRMVAAWPEGQTSPPEDQVTRAEIVHDGEKLGWVTLTQAPGQPLLPTDQGLLTQVASGLGLALRNQALTDDLRLRVEQLRESRRRIVAVQDRTRRQLERDLHDGAQQRLVALKIKLGLATTMAEKANLDRIGGMLVDLRDQADRVIAEVREFARGIYPPLLEAEGLSSALSANFRKAVVPVSLQAAGIDRYPKDTEATVYFCVLTAVAHAIARSANSVQVVLDEDDGILVFEVRDDGVENDVEGATGGLVNLVDRLDAAGGSLDISSRPGHGTLVVGRVPVPAVVAS